MVYDNALGNDNEVINNNAEGEPGSIISNTDLSTEDSYGDSDYDSVNEEKEVGAIDDKADDTNNKADDLEDTMANEAFNLIKNPVKEGMYEVVYSVDEETADDKSEEAADTVLDVSSDEVGDGEEESEADDSNLANVSGDNEAGAVDDQLTEADDSDDNNNNDMAGSNVEVLAYNNDLGSYVPLADAGNADIGTGIDVSVPDERVSGANINEISDEQDENLEAGARDSQLVDDAYDITQHPEL